MTLEVVAPAIPWVKPIPQLDPLSGQYFRAASEGRLVYERCPACGHSQHYPRAVCQRCGATPEWATASGRGVVYSFTVIRQSGQPGFSDELPYVLALVDLDEGPRLIGNITHCDVDDVRIGAAVAAYVLSVAPEIGLPQWRLIG
jgi:uncharacterized OB-fold protein